MKTMNPLAQLKQWARDKRLDSEYDLYDPEDRKRATFHYYFWDHAWVRVPWHNFFQIAPGVYRSNQPTAKRFEAYAALGIKSVLNLRGAAGHARYLFEKEACDRLGLTLIDLPLQARKAPAPALLLELIEVFRTIERPFMMHCKSGADRAGLASAIYLMVIEGAPVAEAKKMLALKYVHLKFSKTGVLDHLLDTFEARQSQGAIGFEDWVRTEYDAGAVQAAFDAKRGKRKAGQP